MATQSRKRQSWAHREAELKTKETRLSLLISTHGRQRYDVRSHTSQPLAASCSPSHISHLFLTCPVAATVTDWLCRLWQAMTGYLPVVSVAGLLAADTSFEQLPSDALLQTWHRLRLAVLHSIWTASQIAQASQPTQPSDTSEPNAILASSPSSQQASLLSSSFFFFFFFWVTGKMSTLCRLRGPQRCQTNLCCVKHRPCQDDEAISPHL